MIPDTNADTPTAGYAYSNHSPLAAAHHAALAEFDPRSIRYLAEHLPPRRLGGARVLVPAAGGGAILHTLSNLVGPDGLVVATDLHPQLLPATLPNVQVLQHDLNTPLPAGPWHLIHARLILSHLPQRRRILQNMIDELAPGGMLIVEDFDPIPVDRFVATAPNPEAARLIRAAQRAHRRVLNRHDNDPGWAMQVHGLMVAGGLTRVHSQSFAECWPGRSAGARLMASALAQVRDELVDTDLVTDQNVADVLALLENPEVVLHGHRLVTTSALKLDRPS